MDGKPPPADAEFYLTSFTVEEGRPWPEWYLEEKSRLETFWNLLVEVAASRSWSQTLFTTTIPAMFAGVLHPDKRTAENQLRHFKMTWDAVLKLESVFSASGGNFQALHTPLAAKKQTSTDRAIQRANKCLGPRLADIAWNDWQLSRELYQMCAENQWQLCDEIYQLARAIFGAPCQTKFELEDVFAHLSSVAKLSTLARPMNKSLDYVLARLFFSVGGSDIETLVRVSSIAITAKVFFKNILA